MSGASELELALSMSLTDETGAIRAEVGAWRGKRCAIYPPPPRLLCFHFQSRRYLRVRKHTWES